MLSFQLVGKRNAVELLCDDSGIDTLIEVLTKLRGSGSHVHLWAPSIVGDKSAVLSDLTPFGEAAIPEVIITHGGD
jgi:hypothetical protein